MSIYGYNANRKFIYMQSIVGCNRITGSHGISFDCEAIETLLQCICILSKAFDVD